MSFGELSRLLEPRSCAVIGASDRDGNLGGLAVRFLRKFAFKGAVYPVNTRGEAVANVPAFTGIASLPEVPDLAVIAVPASAVLDVARECVDAGVGAAVVWSGGFAEAGAEGEARQRELADLCEQSGLKLCGPNCIGVINTSIGLTASFSSMLAEHEHLTAGAVSMVTQSGGIGVMAHSRAQSFGLGFRIMVSCGNEASLGVADFMRALAEDPGTRVLAVYTEGLRDPDAFVDALEKARRHQKPVVVIKGGAGEASGRAALAHTGRLAGSDRTFDTICREFGVIRVYSTEELLDVALQLASMREDQLPRGNRVIISSFGGGSGVVATDQCEREGLEVPPLTESTRDTLRPLLTPLSSAANPVDFTPGMVTNPQYRTRLPDALATLSAANDGDAWLFLAAGFAQHGATVADMVDAVRRQATKPICLSWQAMPKGVPERLAARGIYAFGESARAARTLRHLARHAHDLRHRIRRSKAAPTFRWPARLGEGTTPRVISEHDVASLLISANLPVARGLLAATPDATIAAACEVGFPVVIKAISPRVTHRAAMGLLALNVQTVEAVPHTAAHLFARAAGMDIALEGLWVQHMFEGDRELLITGFRDEAFGPIVGCGVGGGLTEIVDDVVFARAPIEVGGATDLLAELRTVRRRPEFLTEAQRTRAAEFIARFSEVIAAAPWQRFTLEVNPLKLSGTAAAAVDGLLIIDAVNAPHHA